MPDQHLQVWVLRLTSSDRLLIALLDISLLGTSPAIPCVCSQLLRAFELFPTSRTHAFLPLTPLQIYLTSTWTVGYVPWT